MIYEFVFATFFSCAMINYKGVDTVAALCLASSFAQRLLAV